MIMPFLILHSNPTQLFPHVQRWKRLHIKPPLNCCHFLVIAHLQLAFIFYHAAAAFFPCLAPSPLISRFMTCEAVWQSPIFKFYSSMWEVGSVFWLKYLWISIVCNSTHSPSGKLTILWCYHLAEQSHTKSAHMWAPSFLWPNQNARQEIIQLTRQD